MKPIKLSKFARAYKQWQFSHIRVDEYCLENGYLKMDLSKDKNLVFFGIGQYQSHDWIITKVKFNSCNRDI